MYENDNFSGYGTGNENTTGTFSGADLNETRTENSYGYENHSTTQSAAGSTNGYTTYQMGGTTGSNNTEPKKTQKHGGYFRKAMVSVSLGLFWTVRRNRFLCSTAGNRDVYDQHRYRSGR